MNVFDVLTRLRGWALLSFFVVGFGASRLQAQVTNETISTGSFIINMGILPQTDANALRPYGLIYALLRNHNVPIKWVINPGKVRDGVDFSHNGVSYRGGTFIIPAEFRTTAVNNTINSWVSSGVQGANTVSEITVPVYGTIRSFPRWALNPEKTDISTPYLQAAGLPNNAYYVRPTSQLGACDDIFLVPHDDAISSTNLDNWNNVHRGYIWIGCKSGSVMENNIARFLSTTGVTGDGSSWGSPSVTYGFNDEPPMQFLGNTAHQQTQANGANRSYTPNAAWRPTTRRLIHITNSNRSAMVYGPAFGNTNRGWVMMSGGHDYNKDITSSGNRIALIRAMLNFSYMSVLQKSRTVTMTIPSPLVAGVPNSLSFTVDPPIGGLSTQWSSSCGGTFSPNTTSASVSFTPPANATNCVVTVTATDNCGRVSFDSRQVPVSCVLDVQRTVVPVSCFGGSNGAINMTISGAAGPYSWNWTRVSPVGSGSGSGTSITGLSAGTYNVTVSSPSGCTQSFSILVGQPNAIVATATPTAVQCFGQSTGAVNLTVNGGTPGYMYSWTRTSGGFTASTQNLTGLSAGTYNVTITDSRSCTATASAVVSQPTALSVSLHAKTDVNCTGGSTGTINISTSGGTPNYTYLWNDGAMTQNRTGLSAGTYSVTVRDVNNCTAVLSGISINSIENTTLSLQSTNISCAGGSNGSIQLTATGVAPFNVSWSGPSSGNPAGNEIAATGGSYTIPNLVAGTYTLTVTDANGCVSTRSRILTAPAVLAATAAATNISCFGQTGSISLAVNGGTPNYSYSWTGPGGFTASSRDLVGLAGIGTYNVTVTDQNGCTATASALVSGPTSALSLSFASDIGRVTCSSGSDGFILMATSGGTAPYSYLWSNGATVEDPTGLSAGTYTVTVTDANGCQVTESRTVGQPAPLVLAFVKTDPTCPPPSSGDGTITLTVTGGNTSIPPLGPPPNPYTFAWTTVGGSGLNPTSKDQTGLSAGTYSVTVTDLRGCTATLSVTLVNQNTVPTPPPAIIINNN